MMLPSGRGSKPEVSLLRRLPAASSGYRHHAYTSRRGSRHGSGFLLLLLEPLHRAGLGHGLNRRWLAALRGGFCSPAEEFKRASGSRQADPAQSDQIEIETAEFEITQLIAQQIEVPTSPRSKFIIG